MSKDWYISRYKDDKKATPLAMSLYMPDYSILSIDGPYCCSVPYFEGPYCFSVPYTVRWNDAVFNISGDLTWEEAQEEAIRLIADVIKHRIDRLQANLSFLEEP